MTICKLYEQRSNTSNSPCETHKWNGGGREKNLQTRDEIRFTDRYLGHTSRLGVSQTHTHITRGGRDAEQGLRCREQRDETQDPSLLSEATETQTAEILRTKGEAGERRRAADVHGDTRKSAE